MCQQRYPPMCCSCDNPCITRLKASSSFLTVSTDLGPHFGKLKIVWNDQKSPEEDVQTFALFISPTTFLRPSPEFSNTLETQGEDLALHVRLVLSAKRRPLLLRVKETGHRGVEQYRAHSACPQLSLSLRLSPRSVRVCCSSSSGS